MNSSNPRKHVETMKAAARELRRNMTFPERRLWSVLKARQCMGLKFRRQHVIGNYIIDFYCQELRLAVEVDGESHVRPDLDAARTALLERQGVTVIRVTNDDVLRNLEAVYLYITQTVARLSAKDPLTPAPLPRGEGR